MLSHIESDSIGENKGTKKRATEAEDQNKKKNKHNQKMEYMEM